MINIQHLIDDTECFDVIRDLRWSEGIKCSECSAKAINKRGFHNTQA